ncbi:MAG: hypothetical protein Q7T04_04955 [Dehalococcoidia bacterium]|nr:hypothetical protein [Dehalococcoidia bacterium]
MGNTTLRNKTSQVSAIQNGKYPTLVEAGINYHDSPKFRALAKMPDDKVEAVETIYHAGYLIPTEPIPGKFNIATEEPLILKGSHFFCLGHLCTVPIAEQSDNPDYCRGCQGVLMAEKRVTRQDTPDRWSDNDSIFVHFGKRYGVNKHGNTILVKEDSTKPLEGDVSSERVGQKDVTKLGGGDILPPTPKTFLKQNEVMLHPGGRPVKTGKVSRMTEWRRKKRQ